MEGIFVNRFAGAHALFDEVEAVLRAAPRLRLLAADVTCYAGAEVHPLLRNEGALAALRVRKLRIFNLGGEAGVLALAAELPTHTCLREVYMYGGPLGTLAALDAVVDAALALRLASLTLFDCNVTPASAPALARLVSGGALTELYVFNNNEPLLDQPAAALFADALRANSTLRHVAQVRGLQLLARRGWRGVDPGRRHGAPQPAHSGPYHQRHSEW